MSTLKLVHGFFFRKSFKNVSWCFFRNSFFLKKIISAEVHTNFFEGIHQGLFFLGVSPGILLDFFLGIRVCTGIRSKIFSKDEILGEIVSQSLFPLGVYFRNHFFPETFSKNIVGFSQGSFSLQVPFNIFKDCLRHLFRYSYRKLSINSSRCPIRGFFRSSFRDCLWFDQSLLLGFLQNKISGIASRILP